MTSKKTVNLISELESRYLECNICRELFDEEERIPRLLPCHHPFCSECLNKLGRRKDIIKCPTCNAVHKMQKNDPSDFPKDNTRRDLTTFLHAHSDLITLRTCNHCGNTVNVTHKCQQCNIPLCEICQRNHKTENLTHSIILSKSETFPDDDDNLDICLNPRHERAKLKYFCNSSNCQSSVCPSCVIDEHRDSSKHELENIEKAFKKRKKELGNGVKSLRRRISYVESTFQKVSNTLQDERDEFNRELNAIYKRGIGVLEDRKQKVLDVFNIALQKKESRAVTSKDNLDSYLKNATECCNLSEQLINRNNMSSFLNVHQTIDVHLKQYLNTTFENSTDDENHFAKTINFDDILRLFKNNIENLEKSNEDADIEPSIELAKASPHAKQSDLKVLEFIPNIPACNLTISVWEPTTDRHLELEIKKLVQTKKYVAGFRDILGCIILILLMLLVTHDISVLPPAIRGHGNLIGFRFKSQLASQFDCISADNQTAATLPMANVLCKSKGRHYKYKGVFGNTSFHPEIESSIEFSIRFQDMFLQPRLNYKALFSFDKPVFEFGFTNESINTQFLFPSFLSVSAFPCLNQFGIYLSTGNGVLIKSKNIFKRETNSHFNEGRFILKYRPSDLTFFLLANSHKSNTTTELYRVQNVQFRSPFWPVFAAYDFYQTPVLINIETIDVGFDRYTLHSNLFISDDNKTVSNDKLGGKLSSNSFESPVIYTLPKEIENTNVIQTMINIDFDDSNGGKTLFKIGFRERTNGIFNTTSLLTLTKCAVKNVFGLMGIPNYCLSLTTDTNQIIVGNHMSLFLHYHRNGIIELYLFDTIFRYSYFLFQFSPFIKQTPEFYIEKVDAKDIVISFRKNTNILNLERMLLSLFLCIVLLIERVQFHRQWVQSLYDIAW